MVMTVMVLALMAVTTTQSTSHVLALVSIAQCTASGIGTRHAIHTMMVMATFVAAAHRVMLTCMKEQCTDPAAAQRMLLQVILVPTAISKSASGQRDATARRNAAFAIVELIASFRAQAN
mmetsp:Transcript_18867/g.34116  ORF Transcript_18867/g.34116 Transcript_18867/m.34116 type:complete len:120 (-) Transcript_18867:389-748(-)